MRSRAPSSFFPSPFGVSLYDAIFCTSYQLVCKRLPGGYVRTICCRSITKGHILPLLVYAFRTLRRRLSLPQVSRSEINMDLTIFRPFMEMRASGFPFIYYPRVPLSTVVLRYFRIALAKELLSEESLLTFYRDTRFARNILTNINSSFDRRNHRQNSGE